MQEAQNSGRDSRHLKWRGLHLSFMRRLRESRSSNVRPGQNDSDSQRRSRSAVLQSFRDFIRTFLSARFFAKNSGEPEPQAESSLAISAGVKSILRPFDDLPDDMLYEIFKQVITEAEANHIGINSRLTAPAQIVLAGVCRHWRSTIFETSSFWSHIMMDCSRLERDGVLPYDRLKLYLECSGNLPLSLSLTSTDRGNLSLSPTLERLYGELLDFFKPHYRRWVHVTFVLDHRLARKLLNLNPYQADTIKSLSVDFRTRYWFDDDPHGIPTSLVSLFIRFPNITRLDFRSCSPWSYIPSPGDTQFWAKFTDVTINVSYGLPHLVALALLPYLTSATNINLNAYVHRPRADGITREVISASHSMRASLPDPISLPLLQHLKLVVDHEIEVVHDRVLAKIDAPGLETLVLSLDSMTVEDGTQLLRETKRLITSAPGLKKIYLRLWRSRYFPWPDVVQLITMLYEGKVVTKIDLVADALDLLSAVKVWIELHRERDQLWRLVTLFPLQGMSKFDIYPHIPGY